MALKIEDSETEQLAAEVTRLTGESTTEAIRTALRERRQRLGLAHPGREHERIWRRLAEELWAEVPQELLGNAPSQQEQDELLGYRAPASDG